MTTLRRHHLTASVLLAATIAISALSSSASAATPLKITNCNKAASRPKLLTLTCGDGNTALKNMAWSSFGGATASGKGTFVSNTCEPNCAEGKDVSYAVSVKATGSRKCKGATVYAKLSLTYTGAKKPPPSEPRQWSFRCPS
ncbi:MAG TPA: hypothetical protein VG188_06365 [Solirubrobacteraceae bacterium]|jgi:hypothetical protein|nr:hypothetical protein [Solirubrobacteraceae bacterium]